MAQALGGPGQLHHVCIALVLGALLAGATSLLPRGAYERIRYAGSGAVEIGPAGLQTEQKPAPPPRQCQPPLTRSSPWENHCQRLQRVCVDQGTLILYDEMTIAQQQGNRTAAALPQLEIDARKVYVYRGAPRPLPAGHCAINWCKFCANTPHG